MDFIMTLIKTLFSRTSSAASYASRLEHDDYCEVRSEAPELEG